MGAQPSRPSHTAIIEQLPPEMLGEILTHLDVFSLCDVMRTSRTFREAACDNLLWKEIYSRDFPEDIPHKPPTNWRTTYKQAFLHKYAPYGGQRRRPQLRASSTLREKFLNGLRSIGLFRTKGEQNLFSTGLDAAGKTTFLCRLGDVEVSIPTIGMNLEVVHFRNTILRCLDTTNTTLHRLLMRHFLVGIHGLIFFVDSCDVERLDEAKEGLHRILNTPEMPNVPLLVFANKQDLPNALTPIQVRDALDLAIVQNTWHVEGSCFTTGEGLYEGLNWLHTQAMMVPVEDRKTTV